jgi:hypothetical protein
MSADPLTADMCAPLSLCRGQSCLVTGRNSFLCYAFSIPPQELSDFWTALPNATWSDDEDVMTLAEGTSFFGHAGLGNQLYLRDCYPALQEGVRDMFAQVDSHGRRKNKAVAIIGNPGEKRIYVFEQGIGLCTVSSSSLPRLVGSEAASRLQRA